jgi:hypothetical protein
VQTRDVEHELTTGRETRPGEPVDRGEETDVLIDREVFVQGEALGHVADPAFHPFRIAADIDAIDRGRAARGLQQAA